MTEAESTAPAVREVHSAYYNEMGGVGAAPEPKARTATRAGKVERGPKTQPSLSAARHLTSPMIRKSLPALLIFASIVALIVTYAVTPLADCVGGRSAAHSNRAKLRRLAKLLCRAPPPLSAAPPRVTFASTKHEVRFSTDSDQICGHRALRIWANRDRMGRR
jgi:hypothetical protein